MGHPGVQQHNPGLAQLVALTPKASNNEHRQFALRQTVIFLLMSFSPQFLTSALPQTKQWKLPIVELDDSLNLKTPF